MVTANEMADPELSKAAIKLFKGNPRAWEFFNGQTRGYRRAAILWILSARTVKTHDQRLGELITDYSEGTHLKRFEAAAARREARKAARPSPIEEATNVGLRLGLELRSIGIETVAQLKELGWEKVCRDLVKTYPERLNLRSIKAVIGAVEEQKITQLDTLLKRHAKELLNELGAFS